MDILKKRMELNIQFLLLHTQKKTSINNYTKIWGETKRQNEVINDDEPIKYRKDFMKIRFESDDDLPLGKTFNIVDMIIVLASVLEKKNGKHYPHFFFK